MLAIKWRRGRELSKCNGRAVASGGITLGQLKISHLSVGSSLVKGTSGPLSPIGDGACPCTSNWTRMTKGAARCYPGERCRFQDKEGRRPTRDGEEKNLVPCERERYSPSEDSSPLTRQGRVISLESMLIDRTRLARNRSRISLIPVNCIRRVENFISVRLTYLKTPNFNKK